jgi:hypothetical protein
MHAAFLVEHLGLVKLACDNYRGTGTGPIKIVRNHLHVPRFRCCRVGSPVRAYRHLGQGWLPTATHIHMLIISRAFKNAAICMKGRIRLLGTVLPKSA